MPRAQWYASNCVEASLSELAMSCAVSCRVQGKYQSQIQCTVVSGGMIQAQFEQARDSDTCTPTLLCRQLLVIMLLMLVFAAYIEVRKIL